MLADEATRLLHGEGVLEEIRATAATLFGGVPASPWPQDGQRRGRKFQLIT